MKLNRSVKLRIESGLKILELPQNAQGSQDSQD